MQRGVSPRAPRGLLVAIVGLSFLAVTAQEADAPEHAQIEPAEVVERLSPRQWSGFRFSRAKLDYDAIQGWSGALDIRMAEPGDHTFMLGLTFGRDDAVRDDHTAGTRRLGLCRRLAHVRVCATVVWGHSANAVAAAGSTRSPASSAPVPHL